MIRILILFALISVASCKKKESTDINDCDSIGNYYEDKTHFIKREFVTDDGVIDYKKLMEKYKGRDTVCNPLKD